MERVSSTLTRQRTPKLVPLVGYRSACRLPWTPAFRPGAIRVRNTAATGTQPRVGSIRCWGCGQWGTRCCAGRSTSSTPTCPGRARNQPNGDTVKFKPDTPTLVDTLPRRSGHRAQINSRGISVRLEAIDALETHFDNDHQELAGATAAREALLAQFGFNGVTSLPDAPSRPNVEAADQDSVAGEPVSLLRDHRPRQFRGTGRGRPVPRSPWTRFRLDPPIATAGHFSPR